ncbi:MAG: hypothetical protein LBJ39_05685 [Tannerellaceae bacterium]|jgi:hypothetical protein|nr:hypothetical protein [Tannerellaceae bacterium]
MKQKHLVLALLVMSFFSTCAKHESVTPPIVDDEPVVEDTMPADDPASEDPVTIYHEGNESEKPNLFRASSNL